VFVLNNFSILQLTVYLKSISYIAPVAVATALKYPLLAGHFNKKDLPWRLPGEKG